MKKPFFARFLEAQEVDQIQAGKLVQTMKYPSDNDESVHTKKCNLDNDDIIVTMKYPSDSDEGMDDLLK